MMPLCALLATALAGPMPAQDVTPPTSGLHPGAVQPAPGAARPDAHVWNGDLVAADALRGVVALMIAGSADGQIVGGTFCSGTLIHPEWVLTAAHCLDDAEDMVTGGYGLYVGFGSTWPYERQVPWEAYAIHPRYDAANGAGTGEDIGLIQLAEPVTDEPVVRVNEVELGLEHIGLAVRVVGFGVTGDGREDGGTKRSGELSLVRLEEDLLYLFNGSVQFDPSTGEYWETSWDSTQNACQGDSGGATLASTADGELVLVGVNAVVYPGCDQGGTGSTRTDLHAAWIRGYVPLDEEGGVDAPEEHDPYTLEPLAEGPLAVPELGDPVAPADVDAFHAPSVSGCTSTGTTSGGAAAALVVLALRRRRRSERQPASK